MPTHTPAFISTAELNAFGERLRSRLKEGPNSCLLTGEIVRRLLTRWKRSLRKEDKHLIDLIEQLTICEDRILLNGGDLLKELDKPHHGVFGPILDALAVPTPYNKIKPHDALILRFQYHLLWRFVRDHPFPNTSVQTQQAWLATHWKEIEQLLRQSPCHCLYNSPDEPPPPLSIRTTPKQLFISLLAHLHCSTSSVINQFLKASARKT